jgi:hypothetical protein
MSKILKYRIIPKNSEEETFIITKTTFNINKTETIQEVDRNGNLISQSRPYEIKSSPLEIREEITAVGLPSKTPAEVIVLETTDGPTEAFLKENERPIQQSKPINLTDLLSRVRK